MWTCPKSSRTARRARPERSRPSTLTLDAYKRLKAELDELTVGRPLVHRRDASRSAREHGDLRENAEYDAAKNEQGLMEARIRNLEQMLRDPEIVEAPPTPRSWAPGMLVTAAPARRSDPEEETYLLAESRRGARAGVRGPITTTSPLGRALSASARRRDRVRGARRQCSATSSSASSRAA